MVIITIKKFGHTNIDDKSSDEDVDSWTGAGQQQVLAAIDHSRRTRVSNSTKRDGERIVSTSIK